jgi:hypothetical protein
MWRHDTVDAGYTASGSGEGRFEERLFPSLQLPQRGVDSVPAVVTDVLFENTGLKPSRDGRLARMWHSHD